VPGREPARGEERELKEDRSLGNSETDPTPVDPSTRENKERGAPIPDDDRRRVFLTGATGYIGGALARRLTAAGDRVHALVRATSGASAVAALRAAGVEIHVGDVTDRASMRAGMAGADWVVHAAADLDFYAAEERVRRINVDGADNVASLAYKLGCGRFLLLSSIAAFAGSAEDGTPATEESAKGTDFPSLYSATKRSGEEAVREWAKKGLRTNVVWPSLVYGPPGKKSGANALLRLIAKGRMPVLVGGDRRTSWIYVDDLVDGLVRVMDRAEPGRDYLMTGDVAATREVVERTCELAGAKPPKIELPLWLARVAAKAATPYYKLRGFKNPLPPGQLESLGRHWAFDDARARRELDWQPRSLEDGLPQTVEHILGRE
jgi:dihydroflavonol-4-reductase